jgi:diguanylate cyclase (GGDEF)-like protein
MGSREHRRHPRLETRQLASVSAQGASVPCEIRNYCRAGLYLSFDDPRARDAISAWLPDTAVEVAFLAGEAGRQRPFRLAGTVAHASPAGLGLYVESIADDVLQALHAAGAEAPRPPTPDLGPQERQALQQECTSLFSNFLNLVLKDFFSKVGDKFAEAGDRVSGFLEQNRYRHGAQELIRQRSRIQEDFFAAIREHLQQLGPGGKRAEGEEASGELSLVDEGEFDDWLNLSSVVNQIESDVDLARCLSGFERRYGALIGSALDRRNNPFGPEAICRTFQGSTRGLDFSNPMRAVMYKVFGQTLAQHLPALCEQLERVLSTLDATLPPTKPAARQAKAPPSPPPESDQTTAGASGGKEQPKQDLAEIVEKLLGLSGQQPSGLNREAAEYSLERLMAALNRPRGAPAPAQAASFPAASGPEPPRPNLLPVADRLLRAAGRSEAAAVASWGAGAAPPEAGLGELLRVIDALPSVDWIGPSGPDGPPLSERISRSGPGLRIPLPYRQTLDATANLFGHAMAVSAGGSEIETLLKRLERPLLKLSLQDGRFLDNPDHPARQVVDLLEQYAIAADDQGRFFDAKLQRFLYLMVERVCAQADQDPGVYAAVRDNLARLLVPIRQTRRLRVARLQEACEGRDRIRQARARVGDALDARLAGREVAEVVLRLLDAGWRHYLVLLEMRAGIRSEEWGEALAVLDRLLSWLGPEPAAAADGTRQEAAGLMNRIERQLASVSADAAQLEAVMEALARALEAAGRDGHVLESVPYASSGRPAEARPGDDEEGRHHAELLQRLRVGDWWHFHQAGRWLPMQLIWLSQPAGHCAFASRSAIDKVELALADFSQRLRNGTVKDWGDQDRPLLERTEYAMLDEGRQLLQQRVIHDPVTGLLNRKGFLQRLGQASRQPRPDRAHMVSVIEFDQFRVIYHACGVEAGEALTRLLAREVQACVGPEGVVASFRDDTLALFLPNCSRSQGCGTVDSLLGRLKDYRYQHGEHSYSIGLNIGITEYAPALHSPEEAVRHADSACVAARAQGRNRMQVYEQDNLQLQTQESLIDWAGRIDSLLKGSGLYLRAQMVMPIGADPSLLPYYEILLGIAPEPGVEVKPMTFIPAVERLQRAHEVDLWVLRRVFDWIRENRAGFATMGGFSINLSALSLAHPDIIAFLRDTLPRDDIPADRITFEITETAAIESYAAAEEFMRQIRRYGCSFSLDDFGSGYTSYAHLKNLRTDSLKIDGSFVRDMANSPSDYAMVKSMHDIAHSLGMRSVAEYVESPQILAKLREIGVDYAQGYAIHKPCRIDQILPDAAD